MESITLQTKQDLNVFVNPQRQNIMRCMRIAAESLTPKQISDRIGISPSSVQHHIKKLLSIGVIEQVRTESIHGITARYYQLVPKPINVGMALEDGYKEQRLAVMRNAISKAFSGFADTCAHEQPGADPQAQIGDMLYGILHLEPEQAKRLHALILDFLQSHETKTSASQAWEYVLLAYPVEKENHE
jgi:DNA-binding transcriptional ArsR family regulator